MRWARIPAISQYVLIFIAVTFTWLMGLMGYVRSGLKQHWHVYSVIRDQSADAFTPTLGFATKVVLGTVLVFSVLIGLVFWLASLHDRPDFVGARPTRRGAGDGLPESAGHTPETLADDNKTCPPLSKIPAHRPDRCARHRHDGVLYLRRADGAAEGSAAAQGDGSGGAGRSADMVKVGREIMEGKGICLTCHTIGKTGALRFPDLGGIGATAKSRVAGLNNVGYFAQSLYEPMAYVVPGFPPAMPPINQPPISLTDQEILCVVAALQGLGGRRPSRWRPRASQTAARPHGRDPGGGARKGRAAAPGGILRPVAAHRSGEA